MIDDFQNFASSLTTPASAGETIVPSDTTDLNFATRGVYVGMTGTVVCVLLSGDEVVLNDMQAGAIYPLRVRRVKATGTTAAGLVGLR